MVRGGVGAGGAAKRIAQGITADRPVRLPPRRPTFQEISRLASRLASLVKRLRRAHERQWLHDYRQREYVKAKRRAYQKAQYAARPEKRAAHVILMREWRRRNIAHVRRKNREYYARHREAILARRRLKGRAAYLRHRDKILARQKANRARLRLLRAVQVHQDHGKHEPQEGCGPNA